MFTSKEKPKIYETLKKKFGINWETGIAITYGDTCHSKNELPPDLVAHEEVHVAQQRMFGPEAWWTTYIEDPDFRLRQEVEAYRAQVKYLNDHTELMSRNERRYRIRNMAIDLNSHVYGFVVNFEEALKLIKE